MLTAELASQLNTRGEDFHSRGPRLQCHSTRQRIQQVQRTRPNLSNACKKTKLCTYYRQGSCPNGVKCCFAHGEHELVSPPNLCGTKLCPMLKATGGCIRRSCKYAHSDVELRDIVAGAASSGDDGTVMDDQSSTHDELTNWTPLSSNSTQHYHGLSVAAFQAQPSFLWTTNNASLFADACDTKSEASTRLSGGCGESPTWQDYSNDSELSEEEAAAPANDVWANYVPAGVKVTVQRTFLHISSLSDDVRVAKRASSAPRARLSSFT